MSRGKLIEQKDGLDFVEVDDPAGGRGRTIAARRTCPGGFDGIRSLDMVERRAAEAFEDTLELAMETGVGGIDYGRIRVGGGRGDGSVGWMDRRISARKALDAIKDKLGERAFRALCLLATGRFIKDVAEHCAPPGKKCWSSPTATTHVKKWLRQLDDLWNPKAPARVRAEVGAPSKVLVQTHPVARSETEKMRAKAANDAMKGRVRRSA